MKKFLVVFMMLFSVIGIKASSFYTATSVACSINNAPWSDWCGLNCLFVIDQEQKQIRVYSDISYSTYTNKFSINSGSTQIIDYGTAVTTYGTNGQGYSYRLETLRGNDSNCSNCTMFFYVFNDGDLMFVIRYADVSYKYMLSRR